MKRSIEDIGNPKPMEAALSTMLKKPIQLYIVKRCDNTIDIDILMENCIQYNITISVLQDTSIDDFTRLSDFRNYDDVFNRLRDILLKETNGDCDMSILNTAFSKEPQPDEGNEVVIVKTLAIGGIALLGVIGLIIIKAIM